MGIMVAELLSSCPPSFLPEASALSGSSFFRRCGTDESRIGNKELELVLGKPTNGLISSYLLRLNLRFYLLPALPDHIARQRPDANGHCYDRNQNPVVDTTEEQRKEGLESGQNRVAVVVDEASHLSFRLSGPPVISKLSLPR